MEPCLRAWCTAKVARAAILVVAMAAMVVLAAPAQAAAPNYILVTGPGLPRPVLLANWTENLDLLLAVANAPKASRTTVQGLARRPVLTSQSSGLGPESHARQARAKRASRPRAEQKGRYRASAPSCPR